MEKNSPLRYGLILGVICLASSGLLSSVHALTQPKIEEQSLKQEESALKDVFPQAESFEAVQEEGRTVYYKALDGQKNILGVVFKAVRRGYSSDIVTLAGMDLKGVLVRVKVLSQNETPGLGTRAAEAPFLDQFGGKSVDKLDTSVDTITGATITSTAVIGSVQETGKKILEKMKNG